MFSLVSRKFLSMRNITSYSVSNKLGQLELEKKYWGAGKVRKSNWFFFFSTPMMSILQSMVILWQCLKNSSNWTNFSQNFAPIMEKEVLSELWKSKRFWMFSLFAQGKNHDWIIRQSQLLFRPKFWSEFFNNSMVIYLCWEEKFVSLSVVFNNL